MLCGTGVFSVSAFAETPDMQGAQELRLAQADTDPAPAQPAPAADVAAPAQPAAQPSPAPGPEQTEKEQETVTAPTPPPLPPQVAVDAAVAPKPVVGDVSLHGYFRMGWGMSSEKGRQTCFQVAGAWSKFRLGNECDQYGEFHFAAPIWSGKDGVVANVHFMPAVYIPSTTLGYPGGINSGPGEGWNGAAWGFPFMYMDVQNVEGFSGGTAWVGRRYYKREDWHSTDFFYWNPSGLGAGIEDINLGGELKLSYAAFSVDPPPAGAVPGMPAPLPGVIPQDSLGIRNDIQLRGIRLYPGGELQLGLNIVANWSDNPNAHSGWGAIVRHVQAVGTGDNKLAVQYGQGAGSTFGIPDALPLDKESTRLRIVDVLTVDPTDWFGIQAGLVYQHDKMGDAKQDWISVGARGSFAFSEHGKIVLDIGHDNVKPDEGDRRSLTKFTIAPTLSGGRGVMTRPELRLFCTVAMWNDAARAAGVDSAGIYTNTDKKVGATFGVHSEVWW